MNNTNNILFYDADCGFCQASVEYIQAQALDINLEYISYQRLIKDSELQKLYSEININNSNRGVQLLKFDSNTCDRAVINNHYAITYIFKYSDNIILKKLADLIDLPIINKISEFVYYIIAQNRHRISKLIGKTSCKIN